MNTTNTNKIQQVEYVPQLQTKKCNSGFSITNTDVCSVATTSCYQQATRTRQSVLPTPTHICIITIIIVIIFITVVIIIIVIIIVVHFGTSCHFGHKVATEVGVKGKPSRGKCDVFLNIVQKAFDPPPLLFEHLSYFAGGIF